MNRRDLGLIAAVLATALLMTSVIGVMASSRRPSLPPVVFAVETALRQYDIGVSNGADFTLLTDDQVSYAPVWSPDGQQIAYLRGERGSWEECCGYGVVRLWLMDADGSSARAVTDVLPQPGHPEWEPGGDSVLLTTVRPDESARQLVRVSLYTGEVEPVLTPFKATSFSLSPDGASVVSMQDGVRQAVITNLQSGVDQVVAPDVFGYTYEPLWSPDGEWLAMSGLVRGEDSGVWAWNLDNQEAVLISQSEGTEYTWASGDQLLICRDVGKGELWLVDAGEGGTGDQIDDYVKSPGKYPDTDECLGDDMDVRVVRR